MGRSVFGKRSIKGQVEWRRKGDTQPSSPTTRHRPFNCLQDHPGNAVAGIAMKEAGIGLSHGLADNEVISCFAAATSGSR